jgi:hypothetical protein
MEPVPSLYRARVSNVVCRLVSHCAWIGSRIGDINKMPRGAPA